MMMIRIAVAVHVITGKPLSISVHTKSIKATDIDSANCELHEKTDRSQMFLNTLLNCTDSVAGCSPTRSFECLGWLGNLSSDMLILHWYKTLTKMKPKRKSETWRGKTNDANRKGRERVLLRLANPIHPLCAWIFGPVYGFDLRCQADRLSVYLGS